MVKLSLVADNTCCCKRNVKLGGKKVEPNREREKF